MLSAQLFIDIGGRRHTTVKFTVLQLTGSPGVTETPDPCLGQGVLVFFPGSMHKGVN